MHAGIQYYFLQYLLIYAYEMKLIAAIKKRRNMQRYKIIRNNDYVEIKQAVNFVIIS